MIGTWTIRNSFSHIFNFDGFRIREQERKLKYVYVEQRLQSSNVNNLTPFSLCGLNENLICEVSCECQFVGTLFVQYVQCLFRVTQQMVADSNQFKLNNKSM